MQEAVSVSAKVRVSYLGQQISKGGSSGSGEESLDKRQSKSIAAGRQVSTEKVSKGKLITRISLG